MNDPAAAGVAHNRIDAGSRRTLARIAFRVGGLLFFIVLPSLAGLRPFSVTVQLLSTFTSLGSIFCVSVALLCAEHFGRGGLNHWDEALTYMALTRLAHYIQIYHG